MTSRRIGTTLARLSKLGHSHTVAHESLWTVLHTVEPCCGPSAVPANPASAVAASRAFAAQPAFVVAAASAKNGQQKQQNKETGSALTREEERFDAITDQIPQRPVGVVEGTSYTLVILAGLAFAGAIIYAAVNELLIQPKEYACFNLALEKLRQDPRVTVRLGSPISGYGTESRNRAARQRIPHRTYVDANGTEHVQVQFHARGPSGVGRVSADMYKDSKKQWQYVFLYVDADVPVPSRVTIISPGS